MLNNNQYHLHILAAQGFKITILVFAKVVMECISNIINEILSEFSGYEHLDLCTRICRTAARRL